MSEKPISTVQLGSTVVLLYHPTGPAIKASAEIDVFSPFLAFFLCVRASRWWAWTLIKGLSPEEALQVRAKVASLEALKGQRADLGLQRAWEGNYLVSS